MLLVGLRDNTHCFWFECCLVLPLYISFKKLNVSSWTSFSWIPKNAEKLRIEVIGLQHQPPSLCTRSGEPCILPFLYSGKPLLLIPSYLQCKLCNLHKSHFLKSLTWPDFKTTYCTSANQIIIRHVSFCRILARRMCSGGFHLSFPRIALSILPPVHDRFTRNPAGNNSDFDTRSHLCKCLGAPALSPQLERWRAGLTAGSAHNKKQIQFVIFFWIQFGIFSAKSSSQQTKISQNYFIRK